MKPPAFQFYADDFVAGTSDMTAQEVGSYILLLCHQWSRGEIPQDASRLGLVARCEVSAHVLAKFPDGKNARLETERQKQADFRQQCADAGKNGGGNPAFKRGQPNPYYKDKGRDIGQDKGEDKPKINSPSPSPSPSPKSNISFDATKIANRIIRNQDEWEYDNCKVRSDSLKTRPLASVIEPALSDGLDQAGIIRAWCKAVYIAHGAAVDGMAGNPIAYAIATFKEKMQETINNNQTSSKLASTT